MRIAVTIHSLEGLGGTETYVSTIGDQLQRNGHEVWLLGRGRGAGSELAESLGLRVLTDPRDLPSDLDVAIAQDAPSALDLLASHPRVPQILVAHTEQFDVGLPPQVDGVLQAIVTLYKRVHQRVVAQAVTTPVVRMRQPVDIERFKPTTVLNRRPRSAIAFGNYLGGPRRDLIKSACEAAGIDLEFGGAAAGKLEIRPQELLNRFDIVFGKAKVIHEAMGCGRAVYVLDHNGAEGWVTADNYELLVDDNFGGRSASKPTTVESLAADLRNYDRSMGIVNRDLIVANHDAIAHAAELTNVVREHALVDPRRADPANAAELARLVRVNWRHQSDAFRLRKSLELQSLEMGDALWRAEVAEAELSRVREERDWLATRMPRARLRRLLRK